MLLNTLCVDYFITIFLITSIMDRCYSAEVIIYLFIFNSGMECKTLSPKVWQVVLSNIPIQSRIVFGIEFCTPSQN